LGEIMKKTSEYNHTLDSVAGALGIAKSDEDLNKVLIEKVVIGPGVTSE